MLDNFLADEGETCSNRDLILHKDAENNMNGHMSYEEVLRKMRLKKTLLPRIKKRYVKFLGHKIWKEHLKNLTSAGHIKGKIRVSGTGS